MTASFESIACRHLEVVARGRPVAERRCGQARAQPGVPTSGLAGDRLLESFPSGGVLTGLERDRATDPARIGVQRIEVGGGLEVVERPGRVALAQIAGDRHLAHGQIGRNQRVQGREQRDDAGAGDEDANPRRSWGRRAGSWAARLRLPARPRSPAPAPSDGVRRSGAAADPSAPATPRNPSAGPLSAGISQNQSIEPWISQTISGSSAAPATNASSPRRRRAGIAAAIAATMNVTNSTKPTMPGVRQQPQLEAVGVRGLLVGPPARHVVVVEVVLSEAADRMGDERVERDPPEVVATAADVGEVRSRGRASGRG